MANRDFPLPKFFFQVNINGLTIPFQEVSGLDQEAEFLEYRHGSAPEFVTSKRVGMVKTSNLTLKKGVFKGDNELHQIFEAIYNKDYYPGGDPIPLEIDLLDEKGEILLRWKVQEAVPIKFTGTDLKSDANEIAVESIEFVHSGVKLSFE